MIHNSPNNLRNFTIIAHIDHGKSTLADRLLEITNTIEKRKMREQVLDKMELERERGITIKMQPVRMNYTLNATPYTLNLIDTPGHIDFSYEVSRALRAVEGSILLVDATQGVEAQTLSVLGMAKELGLTIIPVVSKIDSPLAMVKEVKEEMGKMLSCPIESIIEVSGKTGEGVEVLLEEIIKIIPPPKTNNTTENNLRALVFDFEYSNHKGIVVFIRIVDGTIKKGDDLFFVAAGERFQANEVGIFSPDQIPRESLSAGEIGYIVTGLKKSDIASVGDTITLFRNQQAPLSGYMNPRPVVWASVYTESQDDFPILKSSLGKLKLSDPSLSFEEETSGSLGRGFRCGFLGMLHLEIITERLKREFGLSLITATPSINYEVIGNDGSKKIIYSPALFPDHGSYQKVFEPWISIKIITPGEYLGNVMQILYEHEAKIGDSETWGDKRTAVNANMPLRELMRNFFDELKSASSGFASLSYEITGSKEADVVRLDILIAEEVVPAFSRVISKGRVEEDGRSAVERLHAVLPKQLFVVKIQAKSLGRIIASETLSAMRKDVTAKLYGGDITRKMKLLEKQKKGKKKMKDRGRVDIPHDVFLKMMRSKE